MLEVYVKKFLLNPPWKNPSNTLFLKKNHNHFSEISIYYTLYFQHFFPKLGIPPYYKIQNPG